MRKVLLLLAVILPAPALAEVLSSSATHFSLRHSATSTLSASELWDRLIDPASWWHPDHTYSGDSKNLTLELKAGGLWQESWEENAVAHGEVLFVEKGKTLRMNAPFGPLQSLGAYCIWTISIAPVEDGSTVTFTETAVGPPTAMLNEVAAAVDFVKNEAIQRLVQTNSE